MLNQIREINLVDFLPKNASDFEIEKSIILNLNRNEHIQKLTILNDFFLVKSGRYLKKIVIDNLDENIVNFKVGNAPFSRTFKKLLLSKYFIS